MKNQPVPTYDKREVGGTHTCKVKRTFDFFGIKCDYYFNVICIGDVVLVSAHFLPDKAKCDGRCMARIFDQSPQGKRYVEQQIYLTNIKTWAWISDKHMIQSDPVSFARELAKGILDQHNAIFETIRQRIRSYLAYDFREKSAVWLENVFGDASRDNMMTALKDMHWPFLLQRTSAPEQFINVLETELNIAVPYYTPLTYEGKAEVMPLDLSGEGMGEVMKGIARKKAFALMDQVLGKEASFQFGLGKPLRTQKNGYTFIIKERSFVECKDPEGHGAKLCIHTYNMACNSIDEVVIAYLNIKHCFDDYMKTAVFHSVEDGFIYPSGRRRKSA